MPDFWAFIPPADCRHEYGVPPLDDQAKFHHIANMMTAEDVRAMLRRQCDEAGSQTAWARAKRISIPVVSMALSGKRKPDGIVLRALELKRIEGYEPITEAQDRSEE